MVHGLFGSLIDIYHAEIVLQFVTGGISLVEEPRWQVGSHAEVLYGSIPTIILQGWNSRNTRIPRGTSKSTRRTSPVRSPKDKIDLVKPVVQQRILTLLARQKMSPIVTTIRAMDAVKGNINIVSYPWRICACMVALLNTLFVFISFSLRHPDSPASPPGGTSPNFRHRCRSDCEHVVQAKWPCIFPG